MVPGIKALLAQMHREIDELEASVQPTWAGVVEPLERIMDRLGRAWGTVSHLKVRWAGVGVWGLASKVAGLGLG